MENLVIQELIGRGSDGAVFEAEQPDGKKFAVKRIPMENDVITKTMAREISILYDLDHPNVVRFIKAVVHKGVHHTELRLIFEQLPRDLEKDMLAYPRKFDDPNLIKCLLVQLLRGISYCHRLGVVHRDIKPANLLLSGTVLKLADFGVSRSMIDSNVKLTPKLTTRIFRAPEMLLGGSYSKAADMWAIGCTLARMARCNYRQDRQDKKRCYEKLGYEDIIWEEEEEEMEEGSPDYTSNAKSSQQHIFYGRSDTDVLEMIFSILGHPDPETCPELHSLEIASSVGAVKQVPRLFQGVADLVPILDSNGVDLLSKLLCLEPSRRISAEAALAHPYLEGIVDV